MPAGSADRERSRSPKRDIHGSPVPMDHIENGWVPCVDLDPVDIRIDVCENLDVHNIDNKFKLRRSASGRLLVPNIDAYGAESAPVRASGSQLQRCVIPFLD